MTFGLVRSPIGSPAQRKPPPCTDVLTADELAPLGVAGLELTCANPRRHIALAEQHPEDRSFWHRSLDPPGIWSLDHEVASIPQRAEGSAA